VVPRLVAFVNDLTNWYVRLNRARLKVRRCAPQMRDRDLEGVGRPHMDGARARAAATTG
jgi:hypothetical protein